MSMNALQVLMQRYLLVVLDLFGRIGLSFNLGLPLRGNPLSTGFGILL